MAARDCTYFKGKRVTVMGLGLLGRGVGDTAYIAKAGAAEVIVTDLKSEEELKKPFNRLKGFDNVRFVFGEHRKEDFEARDLVVVAAGVPLHSPYVAHARKHRVECAMSAALFTQLSGVPIIGVTGTRGKSTVTHMIHHVLSEVTGEKILLGGNVRGFSNLQLLKEVQEDSVAVMELDSWQLQGFGWAGISPHIAVFTSFMEDHMNYYQGSMEAYFADKANIFLHQKNDGVLITTPEVAAWARKSSHGALSGAGEVRLVDASALPGDFSLPIPGAHNRLNAALAGAALRATGLADTEIFQALATFPGVEGRLQRVCTTQKGVEIYNDNNATTPAATIAGLHALGNAKNVILIAGGAYKEISPAPLIPVMEEHCKAVVLIPGTGTTQLLRKMNGNSNIAIQEAEDLEEAVAAALRAAAPEDIILFSPAFASFGQYVNEYERNDEFIRIVQGL